MPLLIKKTMVTRQWNLPAGVDSGTWDYVSSPWIADSYESYFQGHPLFQVDQQIAEKEFGTPDKSVTVADLGCGTGRALLPLLKKGFSGVGIDLSVSMLTQLKKKAAFQQVDVGAIHANLVDLSCVKSHSIDHAMCLFSTLGMIKGKRNRHKALSGVRRIIRPGGKFVVHAHNYWYNLYDPGGPWWLLKSLAGSLVFRDIERGDKHYEYRGLNNMFLHVFSKGEIKDELNQAGWRVKKMIPLAPKTMQPWTSYSPLKYFNAIGWVIVCQ